ncbi:hypothetical protein UA08_05778 [Talaromyces atroroseus]|uniref:Uncharacterized protein n=1 Tax=Talaromyces atroroseus TaxID=1441469 RepID=A0A225ACQ0_TALAT|nr:hypothetical protein UA08_05778 [Talaromyces atroroseus]OKL58892.1 hypothetical protein UA08_05778 [Talaromyces atroroseus]
MEADLKAQIPGIDHVISEYSLGYLTHASHAYVEDADANAPSPLAEAAETVTEILVSASGDFSAENEKAIRNLVEKFISTLNSADGIDAERRQIPFAAKKLDQTIHVGSQRNISSTLGLAGASVDLEAAASRKVESRVDRKKLEKAERKIRAKQDKKLMKNVEYESSRLLEQPDSTQSYEEFFMAVNPLQLGADAQSKSKDIKVDGIDISIGGKRILTDTSLSMAYGRRYGLVGQNGIGKSTLLRALSRREVAIPTHISILHVEQEITGDDTPALQAVLDADVWRKHLLQEQDNITKKLAALDAERSSMADTSKDAARLDQERDGLDITLTDIHAKLAEMESDKAESRAASILAGLGFSPERQTFATKTFSGGWRMRLALARALFCEPDLLLLDEPSNMLDVPSITFLSNYLQSYPSTVLVVSHDRAFLNEVATDIMHQHSERLDYYKGANFESFYATKEERRKNAKREYENQMAQRAHLQAFIDKFRYNAAKSSEAQSRIKKLERMPVLEPPESEYVVHFKFPDVEKLSPPIIQMTGVAFGYTKDKPLLSDVDLDVQLDSRIGIVGPNGAGKTTVLKLLIGQLQPTRGLISQNPRLRVGYFAQHHVDALDLNDSAVGFMTKNYPGKTDEEYRRHLGAFGITGMTGLQKLGLLSGGQKSRVAFACLSLTNPHILVLDEPSNHLDIEAMDALSQALQNFQGGVLMVSHDVTMLQNVCTSLWVCDHGRVEKFDGDVKAYKKKISAQADAAGFNVVRPDMERRLTADEPLLANDGDISGDAAHELSDVSPEGLGGLFIWALTFSAGISGLLFGYDLFALIASPLAGIYADSIGRRKVLLAADALFTIGSLTQALTSTVIGMVTGRSIVGLAVGAASMVSSLYISELSPSNLRGRLVTILSLFITGGQVVAYVVGWLFSSEHGGWRWIVGLGAFPAVMQLTILLFLPESPRWLVQAGRKAEAKVVLTKIFGSDSQAAYMANTVLRDIEEDVAGEAAELHHNNSESNFNRALRTMIELWGVDGNRRALIIAMMLQGFQQLCGFNSLMYFSATLFESLSFSSPTLTSLTVAGTNFVFTLFAFALIDHVGRRRILLFSIPFMIFALLGCALAFSQLAASPSSDQDHAQSLGTSSLPTLILVSLTVYTAAYASGLGTVPWQQSELFPLSVRSLGSALATATNWASNFIVGLTFLPMMEMLTPGWTFVIYAMVCVFGWFGVWRIYPEMSGLSLEENNFLLQKFYLFSPSYIHFLKVRTSFPKKLTPGVLPTYLRAHRSLIISLWAMPLVRTMADQVSPIFRLPGEVVQHVASLLGSDADLLSFALTCRWLAEHVLSPLSGVWRNIFEDQYDSAWKYPSDLLKIEYQTRAFVLAQRVFSRPKESNRERVWLEVIQTLLLESYLPSKNGSLPTFSKNMLKIAEAVRKTNFLNRPMVWEDGQRSNPNPSDLFCSIQLCLTHLCLNSHDARPCLRSNYDIAQVYAYQDLIREPLVQMGDVKLETLLHIRNFWQRHLLSSREQTFVSSYLDTEPKPKAWNRPLEQVEIPTGCWTGYYSCIHPHPSTVEILQEEQTCAGPESEHEAIKMFLTMKTIDKEPLPWSNIFDETFLMTELHPRTFFAGTQGFYITDTVLYRVRGFWEAIPKPQGQIPGWVRICFISYIRYGHDGGEVIDDAEEENWNPNLYEDFDCVYGFEGVLLPGGKIMLGHYFDMLGEDHPGSERGPCIYWEDSKDKDLGMQLAHVFGPGIL